MPDETTSTSIVIRNVDRETITALNELAASVGMSRENYLRMFLSRMVESERLLQQQIRADIDERVRWHNAQLADKP